MFFRTSTLALFFPILTLSTCFYSLRVIAAPEPGLDARRDSSLVLCRNKETVRTIRVSNLEDGGCRTVYTKGGVDRVVGNGQYKESCQTFLSNIKTNLESADWKCKSVATSKVTDFSPAINAEAHE